jgi:hypothetical protein
MRWKRVHQSSALCERVAQKQKEKKNTEARINQEPCDTRNGGENSDPARLTNFAAVATTCFSDFRDMKTVRPGFT